MFLCTGTLKVRRTLHLHCFQCLEFKNWCKLEYCGRISLLLWDEFFWKYTIYKVIFYNVYFSKNTLNPRCCLIFQIPVHPCITLSEKFSSLKEKNSQHNLPIYVIRADKNVLHFKHKLRNLCGPDSCWVVKEN